MYIPILILILGIYIFFKYKSDKEQDNEKLDNNDSFRNSEYNNPEYWKDLKREREEEIKEEEENKKTKEDEISKDPPVFETKDSLVITCGKCKKQELVNRNQGASEFKCSKYHRVSKILT
ncbi:MAG: hypothetical protein NTZ87_02320 [Candidatus Nomurabacteria bacterium]|nr:hypothetical protein [Candidatus Nomurabacteria bacterium]